jgi:transposase InsO family protein
VPRAYGVSQGWVSRLVARHREEGETAFEPRSRRPQTSPRAIPEAAVSLIIELRKELAEQGLDAGPQTIAWHLEHHHGTRVSAATISRYLARAGLVTPEPAKRPKSSYLRFAAELPNECWQADFTHCPLADGTDGGSWPGSMTTPATSCPSPRTARSAAPSSWQSSAAPSLLTTLRPQR